MKYFALSLALAATSILVRGADLEIRQNGRNRKGGNNNTGGNNNNNAGNGNPQTSLTLDPSVICTACTDNGQNPPVDQQTASLTSSNNFVNFCNGKTLTNGQQLVQGSCNGVPIGDIIPSSNMPAAKITFPQNFGTFAADTQFTFKMSIKNMVTGNFVNAQTNYYGAPQQLKGGNVVGHSHVTVQKINGLKDTSPADPQTFAFFKGINSAAVNGELTVDVTAGLPAGVYRFCTMNTSANHTPAMVAIAQHGPLDDCIYATAVAGGAANTGGNNNGANNSAAVSASTSAAAAATSSAAAGGGKGGKGGKNGQGGAVSASTAAAAPTNGGNNGANSSAAVSASTSAAAAATSSAAAGGGRGGGRGGRGGRTGRNRGGRGRRPQ